MVSINHQSLFSLIHTVSLLYKCQIEMKLPTNVFSWDFLNWWNSFHCSRIRLFELFQHHRRDHSGDQEVDQQGDDPGGGLADLGDHDALLNARSVRALDQTRPKVGPNVWASRVWTVEPETNDGWLKILKHVDLTWREDLAGNSGSHTQLYKQESARISHIIHYIKYHVG